MLQEIPEIKESVEESVFKSRKFLIFGSRLLFFVIMFSSAYQTPRIVRKIKFFVNVKLKSLGTRRAFLFFLNRKFDFGYGHLRTYVRPKIKTVLK